jgi:glycosyltransferase involved in cell wall biosynthesis
VHIGVDATCWLNTRGYGRHARGLLRALVALDHENHYTFLVDWDGSAEGGIAGHAGPPPDPLPPGVASRLVRAGSPAAIAAAAAGRRSLPDLWRMSRALSDRAFDAVLFPTAYSYVPTFSRARILVFVHDVIAETYPGMTLPTASARLFWRAKMWSARRRADALLTVSEFSRDTMAERFGVAKRRIFVVGEAPDPAFRRLDDRRLPERLLGLGLDPEAPILVYVGGFGPHKNLAGLLRELGAARSAAGFIDLKLVLVGEHEKEVFHSTHAELVRLAGELSIADRLVFTGFLPDEELVALLNCATALVLPSYMEGFGLPAVEAAACGCPVVATRESPLPGLLGGAGEFFDPHEPGALGRALRRVLESPERRRRMSEAGLAAASRLSWEHAAQQLLDVFRQVVDR